MVYNMDCMEAMSEMKDNEYDSGSSRIAAHDMGFDFTGYEIDKDYYDAQESRFANHISQGNLFDAKEMYT